jgi:hypothetical protein
MKKEKFMALIILLIIFLIIPLSSAEITVTPVIVNSSFIVWQWDSHITLTSLSIDGYTINNADKISGEFILSDIPANEQHTIRIYSVDDSGFNTTTTLPSNSVIDKTLNVLFGYLFFIIAIVLILIGTRVPFIAWVGVMFSIFGIVDMIEINFWSSFVFMCVFVAGVFVAINPGE